MYAAFVDALPVVVSLWQSGFYQLFNATTILPYQNAWMESHLPKDK